MMMNVQNTITLVIPSRADDEGPHKYAGWHASHIAASHSPFEHARSAERTKRNSGIKAFLGDPSLRSG
jgi:hypothetical protein